MLNHNQIGAQFTKILRAKAWTLWKALITAAGFTNPNNAESKQCFNIIHEVLED